MYGIFCGADEPSQANKALAFAQLIQYLDDRSLSLIIRDAPNDGLKALKILNEHYMVKGKTCIIYLYTQVTSLQMGEDKNVTDYLIREVTICNSLKIAGENISYKLLMAITIKGLPDILNTSCTVMTQKDKDFSFLDYKIALKSFKEIERYRHGTVYEKDTIMQLKPRTSNPRRNVACYTCGEPNHKSYIPVSCQQGTKQHIQLVGVVKTRRKQAVTLQRPSKGMLMITHLCIKQTMYKILTML